MTRRLSSIFIVLISAFSAFAQQPWKKITNAVGAFSVEFPVDPKLNETENKAPEGYSVKVKMWMDQRDDVVNYVLYNEMEAGYNILDDTLYLNTVTNQMIERFGVEPSLLEDIPYMGYPGKHFIVEFTDGIAEGKIILRTNRAYFVVSLFPESRSADRKKFMESFKFLPYQKTAWAPYQSSEHFFKINMPSKPRLSEEENEDGSKLFAYYGLDPNSGNNYSVAIDKISPYAQFESDSAILAARVDNYRAGTDSVISEKDVIVDGRPAKDLILNRGINNYKMRVRAFTNGNLSYTIFAFLPYSEIISGQTNQFFDSFRFTGRVPGNPLADKSEIILNDIASSDTTVLNEVLAVIENYAFQEKHVARIQSLIKQEFPDDRDTTGSRKIVLLDALGKIKSPASVPFLREIFPSLKSNKELEYGALSVLSALNTKESNELLLELLPKHTPIKGNIWKYANIFSALRLDSAYAKEFLMRSLPLLSQESYKTGMYTLIQTLLKDKRVSITELAGSRSLFDNDFRNDYARFNKDTVYRYLDDLIEIIAYDKVNKTQLEALKKLSGNENEYLAMRANVSLLRQQQKANDKTMQRQAADHFQRVNLYKLLDDFDLEKNFPKQYASQDSLVISEVFAYVTDEYAEPTSIKIAFQEVLDYQGSPKKFYVVRFTNADDGVWYRAVAGPYATDKIQAYGDLTGSYFDDNPDMSNHDYLVEYLRSVEGE